MAMNEDYVNYELAVKLKAAGFDEPCGKWIASKSFSYYDEDECCDHNAVISKGWLISQKQKERYDQEALPYLSLWQAQKWLRERAIEVDVNPMFSHGGRDGYDWDVYDDFSGYPVIRGTLPFAETYEEALSAGISAALGLIKKGE